MKQIKFKKLHPNAVAPFKATAGAACFDLHAVECGRVIPNARVAVKTGLAIELPEGCALMIYGRSGHGLKAGVRPSQCVGVVDSDYRGEIVVPLSNDDKWMDFVWQPGDRIAQAMIIELPAVQFAEAEELTDTARGAGGFGSTGN